MKTHRYSHKCTPFPRCNDGKLENIVTALIKDRQRQNCCSNDEKHRYSHKCTPFPRCNDEKHRYNVIGKWPKFYKHLFHLYNAPLVIGSNDDQDSSTTIQQNGVTYELNL
jgi:hypothetical protein